MRTFTHWTILVGKWLKYLFVYSVSIRHQRCLCECRFWWVWLTYVLDVWLFLQLTPGQANNGVSNTLFYSDIIIGVVVYLYATDILLFAHSSMSFHQITPTFCCCLFFTQNPIFSTCDGRFLHLGINSIPCEIVWVWTKCVKNYWNHLVFSGSRSNFAERIVSS